MAFAFIINYIHGFFIYHQLIYMAFLFIINYIHGFFIYHQLIFAFVIVPKWLIFDTLLAFVNASARVQKSTHDHFIALRYQPVFDQDLISGWFAYKKLLATVALRSVLTSMQEQETREGVDSSVVKRKYLYVV